MGEVLITRKSQRGGVPPDGFTQPTQILTKSGTWTCPRSGTYYISCIGSGGESISHAGADYSGTFYQAVAAGGGGGIAESKLSLTKGINIIITVDTGVSSFGDYLSANSGETLSSIERSEGGRGGNASGGNIGNYTGKDGAGYFSYNYAASDTEQECYSGGTSDSAKFGGSIGERLNYKSIKNGFDTSESSHSLFAISDNTPLTNGMYPYGSSRGNRSVINGFDSGELNSINNGAVIIEYLK